MCARKVMLECDSFGFGALVLSVGFLVLIGFFVILLSSKKGVLLRAKSLLIIFDIFLYIFCFLKTTVFSISNHFVSSTLIYHQPLNKYLSIYSTLIHR